MAGLPQQSVSGSQQGQAGEDQTQVVQEEQGCRLRCGVRTRGEEGPWKVQPWSQPGTVEPGEVLAEAVLGICREESVSGLSCPIPNDARQMAFADPAPARMLGPLRLHIPRRQDDHSTRLDVLLLRNLEAHRVSGVQLPAPAEDHLHDRVPDTVLPDQHLATPLQYHHEFASFHDLHSEPVPRMQADS